jgi:hypothetical protein
MGRRELDKKKERLMEREAKINIDHFYGINT